MSIAVRLSIVSPAWPASNRLRARNRRHAFVPRPRSVIPPYAPFWLGVRHPLKMAVPLITIGLPWFIWRMIAHRFGHGISALAFAVVIGSVWIYAETPAGPDTSRVDAYAITILRAKPAVPCLIDKATRIDQPAMIRVGRYIAREALAHDIEPGAVSCAAALAS